MSLVKELKDSIRKAFTPSKYIPEGLLELQRYARNYGAIRFEFLQEDGGVIARSTNFQYGSIVTFAPSQKAIEEKIPDAILTAFSIPSSYAKQAGIHRVGAESAAYVPA